MENLDHHSEAAQVKQKPANFSTSRRLATSILVLVAALLLGYIIFTMMFLGGSKEQSAAPPTPAEPQMSAEELAIQRLQAFEQKSVVPMSEADNEKLDVFRQKESIPTQEQLDRLEQFAAE